MNCKLFVLLRKQIEVRPGGKEDSIERCCTTYWRFGGACFLCFKWQRKRSTVGTDMVKKIRKAAAELNYQPNLIVKSLRWAKQNPSV